MWLILELTLSFSKNIFNHKEFYNETLYNSGYKNELEYLKAKRHLIDRSNNIGNNGKKKIGETMELIII